MGRLVLRTESSLLCKLREKNEDGRNGRALVQPAVDSAYRDGNCWSRVP